jgi:2-polyprenyl-3-methyl-5-hydroxy-6-metoxy-1,4-benzoquinol methylase
VICNSVFPHFEDQPAVLRKIFGLLTPGGILIISHAIGRDAVNRVHSDAAEVAEDIVPDGDTIERMLQAAGFVDTMAIDEKAFYLARGRKGFSSLERK